MKPSPWLIFAAISENVMWFIPALSCVARTGWIRCKEREKI